MGDDRQVGFANPQGVLRFDFPIEEHLMLTEWKGCYKRGWGRELVPEAFAHPAKVSFSLAERIYAHMAAEGWIEPGMTVVDPFGGIGGLWLSRAQAWPAFRRCRA